MSGARPIRSRSFPLGASAKRQGGHMTDDDIHAFGPPHRATTLPAAKRRGPSLVRWLLLAALVLLVLATAVGAIAWMALADATREGLNVTVNGEPWATVDIGSSHGVAGVVGAGLAVLLALATVFLVVPFTVLLALLMAVLALALGLGGALLAVAAVAVVVLSPLWLILLLLWLGLRRRPAATATMPG